MELDASKSQDFNKIMIMPDIQVQYGELAQNNLEELDKYWYQESTPVVIL